MKLTKEGIEEYRKLVERKYRLKLDRAQAEQGFRDLLWLFRVIYRPMREIDGEDSGAYNECDESR